MEWEPCEVPFVVGETVARGGGEKRPLSISESRRETDT